MTMQHPYVPPHMHNDVAHNKPVHDNPGGEDPTHMTMQHMTLSKKEKSTQVVLKSKNTTKSQEKSSISQKSIASQV
jgi:hypothetical protein